MPTLKGKLLCAGVDYITATQIPSDELELLRAVALSLAEVEMSLGMFGKPYAASGYQGFKVGHVSYGEREDGCMIRLGGPCAASHWRRVYELCGHVTRIDLQATYAVTPEPPATIKKHYDELMRWSMAHKMRLEPEMMLGRNRAYTVYSGKRVSDTFLRIYDKGRQSKMGQFEGCVRYEGEFKGKRAQLLAHRLSLAQDEYRHADAIALGLLTARGCCLTGLSRSFYDSTSLRKWLQCPAKLTDVERSLKWLGVAVRPTVDAIVRRKGQESALKALGLSHLFEWSKK